MKKAAALMKNPEAKVTHLVAYDREAIHYRGEVLAIRSSDYESPLAQAAAILSMMGEHGVLGIRRIGNNQTDATMTFGEAK